MNTLTLRQCQSSPAFRFKPFSFLKLTFVVATLISLAACGGGGGGSSTGGGNNEDTTAPTVRITPTNNTTNISAEPSIKLDFSEVVSGVTSVNVLLSKNNDGSNPVTITLTGNSDSYTLIPVSKLDYKTQYYLVLKAAQIKDAADNALGATDQLFSFTTQPQNQYFTSWVGPNDSEVTLENNLPVGVELYSYRDENCDIANITTCPNGQMLTPNNRKFTDPAFNLTNHAYYAFKNQSKTANTFLSTKNFVIASKHQTVTFKNKLWLLDGDSNGTVWSSIDGITWKKETENARFLRNRVFHQVVVFNNKLWVIGGNVGVNPKNDIWSSSDGINWTQVSTTGTIFSARYGHQVTVFNNKLWLTGGFDSSVKNDVWSSSDGISWNQETTAGSVFTPRHFHRVVSFDNKLWVIGGMSSVQSSSQKNDVYSSIDGINWTKVNSTGSIFSARSEHQVVVFNNHLWVIGGGYITQKNDVWKSADGASWTKVNTTSTIFSERNRHQLSVFNNKLWLIGGLRAGNRKGDIWSSTDGSTWKQRSNNAAFTARSNHQVVTFNNKFWMIGGNDGSDRNDVWSSIDGINWIQELANNTSTSSTQFSPRQTHQVVSFNNKLWVIGGKSNGAEKNDVWSSSDGITWTEKLTNNTTTSATQFSPRQSHAAFVFNNKIWVIGGYNSRISRSDLNDVWSSSNGVIWTQSTTTSPIFSARQSLQALVFNNKIWVIGGYNSASRNNLNDVWSSSDGATWTESSVSGTTFTARRNHRAVVFNNKIWVVGGYDSVVKNDVWSSSDGSSWTAATSNASFSARRHHELVSFNNKLWVIAGRGGIVDQDEVWQSSDGITWRKGYKGELKQP